MESNCLQYLPVVGAATSESSNATTGPKSETLWRGWGSLGVKSRGIYNTLPPPSQQNKVPINRYQVRELLKKLDEKKGMVDFR